jgi:hypothetical protein
MLNHDRLIKGSRFVVRIASIANRLFLLACVLGLIASWIFSAQFATTLLHPDPVADVPSATIGLRFLILIGITMSIATDRLLAALAQVIDSAGAGDPFISANARRLRTIGWCLLALQLLDIPGPLLSRFFPSMGSAAPSDTFSVGGWLSVLMVFVLSRVFAAGSAMRDDLEGTV